MLRRYRSDPSHIISPSEVEIQVDMSYKEEPMRILASEVKELRNKRVPLVKVLWLKLGIEEATWETESSMKERYPNLFTGKIFGDENFLSGGELWQPKVDPSREVVSGPLNRVTEMFECDIYCLEYVIMNVWKFQASI